MDRKKVMRIAAIAAVILLAIFAFSVFSDSTRGYHKVDTSVAIQQLNDGNVKSVQINDREQQLQIELKNKINDGDSKDLDKIVTQYPARASEQIFEAVQKSKADSYNTKVTQESWIMSTLSFMLPMLILFFAASFLFSRMQGGSGMGGMFGFGKSRAKELTKDMPKTNFSDVAGADEAVEELTEIRDFLQGPERYEQLGAKIPRGVLLYGPPGTGKTLLARAVAGEAGVPFFSISGSDFVEMFVGVGASRVRDLFAQAKENSPCIIFVDEIDAVGRQRGAGMGGGHDEREQTLNQLLVEMDGFGDRQGVILIAATNRPDILDPALLRPGRFDRQIPVTNPDLAGREQILKVHAKDKPLGPDVDLKSLAKRTAGMSGADLSNVLNEAALLTARVNGNIITADALEEATDRVVGGPRRSSKIISEHEKKVTAYHEGGHTLAAWAMQDIERVYKVTILARGRTGGHAMTAAEDDKGMYNRAELFARLVFAMGGRSGEELIFGSPTTGASADIEQATKIARAMVTEYGMSPDLGAVKYGEEQGDPFAGRGGGGTLEYSDEVAATIDRQVRFLIEKAHDEAYAILKENRDTLDLLAEKLLEKETLRRPDLEKIFENVKPRPRLSLFDDEDKLHPKDDKEPVKTPVERARERGEEPPKRMDFLEASRQARREREAQQAQLAQQGQQAYNGQQPQGGSGNFPNNFGGGAGVGAGQAGQSGHGGQSAQNGQTTGYPQQGANGSQPGANGPTSPYASGSRSSGSSPVGGAGNAGNGQGSQRGSQPGTREGNGYDDQTTVLPNRPGNYPGSAGSGNYPGSAGSGSNGIGGSQNDQTPIYGGTPPPAGWTAPGWPPADQAPRYNGAPQDGSGTNYGSGSQTGGKHTAPNGSAGTSNGGPHAPYGQPRTGQHPGMTNYGPTGESTETARQPVWGQNQPASEAPQAGSGQWNGSNAGQEPAQELRGFRLPENERPDNPWVETDEDSNSPDTTNPETGMEARENTEQDTQDSRTPGNNSDPRSTGGAHRAPNHPQDGEK